MKEYKDVKVKSFANYFNLEFYENLIDIKLLDYSIDQNTKKINLSFELDSFPTVNDFFAFIGNLDNIKDFKVFYSFSFLKINNTESWIEDFLKTACEYLKLNELNSVNKVNNQFFYDEFSKSWKISLIKTANEIKVEKELLKLNKFLDKIGIDIISCFIDNKDSANNSDESDIESSVLNFVQNFQEEFETNSPSTFSKNKFKKKQSREIQFFSIKELNENFSSLEKEQISVTGTIYKKELLFKNNNFEKHNLFITDYDDAIKLIASKSSKVKNEFLDNLEVGKTFIFYCYVDTDQRGNKYIQITKVNASPDLREYSTDHQKIKRIEFNCKSKNNTLDGLLTPEEIVAEAKRQGHSAVGISDYNSIFSFPEFYYAAKANNIKPIYGAGFAMLEDTNGAFLTEFQNQDLITGRYVVFDIETTSLSAYHGEIIEFAATIIENKAVVDKVDIFIKSKEKLSHFTTRLTSITNEMLDQKGIELKEALQKIYDVLNNNIAVAHNANFDYNFLIEKFDQNNMQAPKCTFIDSLVVSRILFEHRDKHNLNEFCRNLNVNYDTEKAHRALYDTEVLADAWIEATLKLKNTKQISNFQELSEYKSDALFSKHFSLYINTVVKNQAGLKELFQLVSIANTKTFYGAPKIFWSTLKSFKNILVGSNGVQGELFDILLLSSRQRVEKYIQKLDYIEIPHPDLFDSYLDRNQLTKDQLLESLQILISLAKKHNKLIISTAEPRYRHKGDREIFKVLTSFPIRDKRHFLWNYKAVKAGNYSVPNFYFLTTDEMLDAFSFLKDKSLIEDIVVNNAHKLNNLIDENIEVIKTDLYPPSIKNSSELLKDLVYKNAKKKYGEVLPKLVQDRIDKELIPIINYKFDVVYWISHILVKKANDDGYVVGSRGSVGSSLIATLINITEVNPLEPHYICDNCKHFEVVNNDKITSGYDLDDKNCPNCDSIMDKDGHSIPFETFLGFKADKVPDIDLNFSGEYQIAIHNYTRELFGEDKTFRAGTVSSIQYRKAFGFIKKYIEDTNTFYSNGFIDYLAEKCIDVKVTTGKHAGGIVVLPENLDIEEFTPVNYASDGLEDKEWKTTHFKYDFLKENLLKLDLLGHSDPTQIRFLEQATGLLSKNIPKKDKKLLKLFSSTEPMEIDPNDINGETTGAIALPEFGTKFTRGIIKTSKPHLFADLISISGLSHGQNVWKNNAEDLILNENKTLNEIVCCRDDIMNYLIKKGVDASLSFKVTESVRKGKGVDSEDIKILSTYNIPDWFFDSMQKIKYMFPRAHAVAYVIMAWRMGYYKLYYPLEFYASFFSVKCSKFDLSAMIDFSKDGYWKIKNKIEEIEKLIRTNNKKDNKKEEDILESLNVALEMYSRGFTIQNIDIEKSDAYNWIIDKDSKSLIPPFSALDGIEAGAIKIINARKERPFKTILDFAKRSGVSSTIVEKLKELNVFKDLPESEQLSLFG